MSPLLVTTHPTPRVRATTLAVLVVGLVATAAAAVAGGGDPAIALAPAVCAAVVAAIILAPVRVVLMALMFLALALDSNGEAASRWASPLAPLGSLLTHNLNTIVPIEALRFNVVTVVIFAFVVVEVARQLFQGASRQAAGPGRVTAGLALGTGWLVLLCVWGLARGGDLQMARLQSQGFALMIAVGYLFTAAVRDARDIRTLAIIVIAAACSKACLALWVRYGAGLDYDFAPFATTHEDSVLFASAFAVLVISLVEGLVPRYRVHVVGMLVLLALAIGANNRRIAWMEISATLVTLWLISARTRRKVLLMRAALLMLPVVALYVAVGWNSNSRLFKPVHLFRSVGDAQTDRSTFYRDVENFNLISTFQRAPVVGSGLGQPFDEPIKLDDISKAFPQYRFVPHNSVLWLWTVGGVIGFTAVWSLLAFALFAAARAYFNAHGAERRAIAFGVIATLETYMIQCWGDMGFINPKAIFVVGAALAVAVHLERSERTAIPVPARSLAA
jgi:O-Antigen ligase